LRQDAMKCLARLGDTKKMMEFAQLARDPSLFVLAANYLRSAQVNFKFERYLGQNYKHTCGVLKKICSNF
jgi:hypothetical protein